MAGFLDSVKNGYDSVKDGLFGLIGQGIQMSYDSRQADKEREWNEQMMDKQNDWSLNMWNMTNEYNSPSSQKQRLLDAGLNPLYYGLDGSSANGLESAQALGYQRASMAGMPNPIESALQASLLNAQIENVRADTGLKTNQSSTEVAKKEQIVTETQKAKQAIENMIAEKELTDEQTNELRKTISWIDRLNEAAISSSDAQTKFTQTQEKRMQELIPKELMKADADIREINKAIEQMDANIKKMAAETELTYEDIYWYTATHMSAGVLGSGISVQNISMAIEQFLQDHPKLNRFVNGSRARE